MQSPSPSPNIPPPSSMDCPPANLNYSSYSKIENGWFRELNHNWQGYSLCLEVEEVLFEGKSEYHQDVLVYRSKSFGNVLVLNGITQCTERDEFTYQEMISHFAMNLHANPEKVLIIGGGDGGVIREVLKYPSVKQVVLCEIDQMVLDIARKYLPRMSCCMDDPRVTIHVGDGIKFVEEHKDAFDIIITDSSDPEGPAVGLFQKAYFAKVKDCLRENGIMSSNAESIFLDVGLVKDTVTQAKEVFPKVGLVHGTTPSYPTGLMAYMLASKSPDTDFRKPVRTLSDEDLERMELKYYNSDFHAAAFAIPNFARRVLKGIVDSC